MRKFANDCGASIPTSLRGTMLRKHIATYTAMLRLEENQVSDLANFMGHDKQIHKDVYRVPNGLIDMTEVSRLLQAAIGMDENKDKDSDEENNENEENTEDDNMQARNESIDDDSYKNDSNVNTIDDEPEPRSSRRNKRRLNYDSDDDILNSSDHYSNCKLRKTLYCLFVFICFISLYFSLTYI